MIFSPKSIYPDQGSEYASECLNQKWETRHRKLYSKFILNTDFMQCKNLSPTQKRTSWPVAFLQKKLFWKFSKTKILRKVVARKSFLVNAGLKLV